MYESGVPYRGTLWFVVLFAFECAVLGAEPATDPAEALVRRGLKAELAGDNKQRWDLLRSAVVSFPDHAPARWHAGMVRVGDEWLPVELAEKQTAQSGLVAEYRKLRNQYAQTAAGQIALARWCRKHQLADQERLHWFAVLHFDPSNREARGRLALREFRGMLLTKDQIEQYKRLAEEYERAEQHWKPSLTKWRKAIESDDPDVRDKAQEQLRAVEDPAAIPWMEEILSTESETLALEVVDIVGNMKGQAAVDSLVRHAVLPDSETVRQAAAERLRERSRFSYVPQLLGALKTPIELSYFVKTFANGVQYGYEATQERPDGVYQMIRSHAKSFSVAYRPDQGDGAVAHGQPGAGDASNSFFGKVQATVLKRGYLSNAFAQLSQIDEASTVKNETAASLNARLFFALRQSTGREQCPDVPQDWWRWWVQYNELQSSRDQLVRIDQQATSRHNQLYAEETAAQCCTCFLPGTMVWTDTGTVAIEKVRIGDRVLSQHQETGKIGYKLVLDTTIRPPSPTLRLGVGTEEIVATLGHPIWVTGLGWQMTKELKAGDLLHGVHGSVPIDYIEKGPESEAYNLVVADFNTYFIGQHRVLVHDNRARRPTDAILPGLTLDAR